MNFYKVFGGKQFVNVPKYLPYFWYN